MYNEHAYFSLKNLGKKYVLYMAKCGILLKVREQERRGGGGGIIAGPL